MRVLAAAAVALACCGLASAGAPRPVYRPAEHYYLALGDSIAFGYQPAKANARLPASGFDTGYVDDFATRLRKLDPKLRVVNYSCPGETTISYVRGNCPWILGGGPLHSPFRGSQQAAALAFLRAHPGQVSPITITLWGNDLFALAEACGNQLRCELARGPKAISALGARLRAILGRLREAAPHAEIIVTGDWNEEINDLGQTNGLFRAVDRALASDAASVGARYAELIPVFSPFGNVAREKARVCALTFICAENDPHPTDAGYRAIAGAVFAASGYPTR